MVRGSARQDRRAGVHHLLHPEAAAGIVRPEGSDRRDVMSTAFVPVQALAGPRSLRLLSAGGWSFYTVAAVMLFIVLPVLHLLVPPDSALYLSTYWVTLIGKIMCYAIVALAMDLIWGYTGILSLGHGLFFALGGYAMGMYLMRS